APTMFLPCVTVRDLRAGILWLLGKALCLRKPSLYRCGQRGLRTEPPRGGASLRAQLRAIRRAALGPGAFAGPSRRSRMYGRRLHKSGGLGVGLYPPGKSAHGRGLLGGGCHRQDRLGGLEVPRDLIPRQLADLAHLGPLLEVLPEPVAVEDVNLTDDSDVP